MGKRFAILFLDRQDVHHRACLSERLKHAGPSRVRSNGLELDKDTRTVTVRGEELVLTRSEFDLLHELLRSSGAVRTKGDLVRVVRGQYYRTDTYISEADERAIEVHIGNLRRKLGEDSRSPRWLMTVRGVGYRLVPRRVD